MVYLTRILLTVLTIGCLACGHDSTPGITNRTEGSVSDPVRLQTGVVTGGFVGKGTSYYFAPVSPNRTWTVTILQLIDHVRLSVHKGGFSSPIECTSDNSSAKAECSVTMSAQETSIYIEVINDNTVLGTNFTISVH